MGVISGVSDLAPASEKLTGHTVIVRFEQAGAMNEKVGSGAPADVAAMQPARATSPAGGGEAQVEMQSFSQAVRRRCSSLKPHQGGDAAGGLQA
jgi:hypothetical protein